MSLNAQAKDASKMPVFDGDEKNWTSWKRLFRSYLRRNSREEFDLLDAVTKTRNGDRAKTLKLKDKTRNGDEAKILNLKDKDAPTEELLIQLYDSLVLACRGQAAAVITTLPIEDDEDGMAGAAVQVRSAHTSKICQHTSPNAERPPGHGQP